MSETWLQIARGPQVERFRLVGNRVVIGRVDECDVVLRGDGVSRQHAELVRRSGAWHLRDLGSRNGTLLNGLRVGSEIRLAVGDVVRVDIFDLKLLETCDPLQSLDEQHCVVRSAAELEPPRLSGGHLSRLIALGGALLANPDRAARRAMLCDLLLDVDFHAGAALVLRVDPASGDATPVCSRLAGDQAAPHVSRSALRAIGERGEPALAVARDARASTQEIRMTVRAGAVTTAAIVCPLRRDDSGLEALYVVVPETYGTGEWLALVSLAATQLVQADDAWAAREAAQQRVRIEEEIRRAQDVQSRLIPRDFAIGGHAIAFGFEAYEGVGGDYIDALLTRDGRVLVVGMDVAGKGIDAAIIAAALHTTVHLCANLGISLLAMARTLNRYLVNTWGDLTAVTMAAYTLDPATGTVESLTCGHPQPLIVSRDGAVRELHSFDAIPLGMLPTFNFETRTDRLAPGDMLAIYSDGLSELFDERDHMLGSDGVSRLLAAVHAAPAADDSAAARVAAVFARLAAFRGAAKNSDDISFALLVAPR